MTAGDFAQLGDIAGQLGRTLGRVLGLSLQGNAVFLAGARFGELQPVLGGSRSGTLLRRHLQTVAIGSVRGITGRDPLGQASAPGVKRLGLLQQGFAGGLLFDTTRLGSGGQREESASTQAVDVAVDESVRILFEQGHQHLLERDLVIFVVAGQLSSCVAGLHDQARGGQTGRFVRALGLQQHGEVAQQAPTIPAQLNEQVHKWHLDGLLPANHQHPTSLRASFQAHFQALQGGRPLQTSGCIGFFVGQSDLQVLRFGRTQARDGELGPQRLSQRRRDGGRTQCQRVRHACPHQQTGQRELRQGP